MMSRQRDWQLKKAREGRCQTCGKKLDTKSKNACQRCMKARRDARNKKCNCAGWRPGRPGRPPFGREQEYKQYIRKRLKRIRQLSDKGYNQAEIAATMKCSKAHVAKLFRRLPASQRNWAWWRKPSRQKDVKRLIRMYKAGFSRRVICAEFNISALDYLLKQLNVKPNRKPGRPRKS